MESFSQEFCYVFLDFFGFCIECKQEMKEKFGCFFIFVAYCMANKSDTDTSWNVFIELILAVSTRDFSKYSRKLH